MLCCLRKFITILLYEHLYSVCVCIYNHFVIISISKRNRHIILFRDGEGKINGL